jgi:hypothetical protein
MKRIAVLMLFIFGMGQVLPAVLPFAIDIEGYSYTIDKEKSDESKDTEEKKEKKEDYDRLICSTEFTASIRRAFYFTDNMLPFPCLEKLTPPPNKA